MRLLKQLPPNTPRGLQTFQLTGRAGGYGDVHHVHNVAISLNPMALAPNRTVFTKPAMSGASCWGAAMGFALPPAVFTKLRPCTHMLTPSQPPEPQEADCTTEQQFQLDREFPFLYRTLY